MHGAGTIQVVTRPYYTWSEGMPPTRSLRELVCSMNDRYAANVIAGCILLKPDNV